MIMDELLKFADGVDAGQNATAALFGDVIDLGSTPQDLGIGDPMYLVIQFDADAAGGTSAQFELKTDAQAAIVAGGSTHVDTGAIVIARMTEGTTYVIPLPVNGGVTPYERYMGLWVTTVGNMTANVFSAFLTKDPTFWTSHADAQN